MYPFLFSTSRRLTSAGLFTHSSMFLTGIWWSSFVKILNGAVSLGVLCLSDFTALAFFDLGVAFGRGLPSVFRGELDDVIARPLRVVLLLESSPFVDLGVGGENKPWSCCCSLAIEAVTRIDFHSLKGHCTARSGNTPPEGRIHPGFGSALYSHKDLGTLTYCIPKPSPRRWLSACDACEGIPSCATELGEPYPGSPDE